MKVYVVSAPSGAGKTTLNRRLIENHTDIEMSVSHTTRAPRPKEINGSHYHFITKSQFEEMVNNNEFIEWAEVHGNLYGTTFRELNRIIELQRKPILEIDVQGWDKAKNKIEHAESIFILPPSLKSLWERLESRGSDSLETRWIRLQNAYDEISHAESYRHFIVNNNLEMAYQTLRSLIVDGIIDQEQDKIGRNLCKTLNEEFKSADWIMELRKKMA